MRDDLQSVSDADKGSATIKPILRWAGSKQRSLPNIAPYLPTGWDRYIEAFAGSACLFFHLDPDQAILVDNNVDLMRFYGIAKERPKSVFQTFRRLPRDSDTYYRVRSAMNDETDPVKRAAYFLYLNRNCFNGIYRTNNKGEFNVPFSGSRVAKYQSEANFIAAIKVLNKAVLQCRDFENVCSKQVRRGDFIYLDPPYYMPRKRIFREYSSEPFSKADVGRLEQTLRRIDRAGATFLLSYPDCAISKRLAASWNKKRINVRRTVAGNVAARGATKELLIFNYDPCYA
ncbi:Dam family site-specific DNA-(adenine-N6)-methyltransferase [Bradyrhizobium sp. LHD-71]|uniref:DNA adenine methylase n=1 Tax=Bradyrhizobium sp. LHD-71 TaxID=3072141 RepID=UPI00280C867F|nr:Dam family site-specific DNA-(adenine-N6)-methyltransferase [Bradyrhizobium sp. LHD-71]MDQ8732442.1 Dam family site-specific DNA-(adenine-N6)-methyltransferase [Bradyrhizobium sp. LHD-71]